MLVTLLTIGLMALCFAGIAIKILAKKDGEFAGTCSTQNAKWDDSDEPCSFCGKMPEQQDCQKDDKPSTAA
jgi:hypothetical protein